MEEHHGGLEISPLLVGLLGVIAGALIVATLHCIIVCWCRDSESERSPTRRRTNPTTNPVNSVDEAAADYNREQASSSSGSFSNVQLIINSNYCRSSKGSKEDDDICAVCLSEFNEGDEVRVLPECTHTFHVSCIDKWLHSHRNCPLCRAESLPSLPHTATGAVPPPQFFTTTPPSS